MEVAELNCDINFNVDPCPTIIILVGDVDTLLRKLKWVKSHSTDQIAEGIIRFFGKATSIIICVAYTVVSMSMITLGIIYRTECPAQWYIPIYSILTGVIQMCLLAWIIAVNVDETTTRTQLNYYMKVHLVQRFIFGIMLIWCGLGLYFVCSIAWPSSDASHIHSYCHPALYLFTLIVITVKCLLLCTCCLCCLTTGCCLMYGKCHDPTLSPSD